MKYIEVQMNCININDQEQNGKRRKYKPEIEKY